MSLSQRLQSAITQAYLWLLTILPFIFFWVNDELFEFNKMMAVYIFTAFITGCFILRMIVEKRLIWQKTIFDWPLGLFLLSQIIATIISMHPRTSWLGYYTRLNGGLLSTISYLLLYLAYINNVARRDWGRMLGRMFFASILVSLYAIGEHFGHSFSCLIIKGNFNVSCWVQDVQSRVFATFGQPNWLAAYNVTLIGLGTTLLFPGAMTACLGGANKTTARQVRFYQRLIATAIYLNYLTLLFTKSRSGIIAFFAGLGVTLVLLLYAWRRARVRGRENWRALGLIILGFIIPSLIWGTQYTPALTKLLAPAQAQTASASAYSPIPLNMPAHLQGINTNITDSTDIRKIVWRGALAIWRAHPFFGTGVETFAYSYYAYRPSDHNWTSEWDFLYNKAHNELLNFAANSGSFGLLTYLSIFIVVAFVTLKVVHGTSDTTTLTTKTYPLVGLAAALLALSITNFFGFSTVMVQVLLFLDLAWLAQIYGDLEPAPGRSERLRLGWQKVAAVITIGGVLLAWVQVNLTWQADRLYAACKSGASKSASLAGALEKCQVAINLRPREAVYQIELGDYYAQYAVALARQTSNDDPNVQALVSEAAARSDAGFALNKVNLNFYKTRFRTFTNLTSIDPTYLFQAQNTLEQAMLRSPTDPKLTYYTATILDVVGKSEAAQEMLERTLTLRPLYLEPRLALGRKLLAAGDYNGALAHYQFILDYVDSANATAKTAVASLSATPQLEK